MRTPGVIEGLVLATVIVGVAMVVGFSRGRQLGACPDGYVGIFRSNGSPACAAYVVEPVR